MVGLGTEELVTSRCRVENTAPLVAMFAFLLLFQKWSFLPPSLAPKEHSFTGCVSLSDWYPKAKGRWESDFYLLLPFLGASRTTGFHD